MTLFRKNIEIVLLVTLLVIAGTLRLYNISHGQGIHPDERHMIMVAEKLSLADMNPHSFAYGSFPYYLLWFSSRAASLFSDQLTHYDGLFLVGRVLCGLVGVLGVLLLYYLSLGIYKDQSVALSAAALLAFNVLHLQLSRFYTVDVILTTLVLATMLALLELYRSRDFAAVIGVGFFFGLSLATKVSALFLLAPIGTTFVLLLIAGRRLSPVKIIAYAGALGTVATLTFITVQPYSLLDYTEFIRQVKEQTSMVQGLWRPPYTIQYEHTAPYFYHLRQIFLFTMGWPLALAAALGILACIRRQVIKLNPEELILLALLIPTFLVFGRYQVKFPRYLLPLYPISILLGAKFLLDFARSVSAPMTSPGTLGSPQLLEGLQDLKFKVPPGLLKALPLVLTGLALCACLLCIGINSFATGYESTLAFWLLSIGFALGALWLYSPPKANWRGFFANIPGSEAGFFILAMALAFYFRTYQLSAFPIQLHNDEMSCGLEARKFLLPQTPALFGVGWLLHPNLGFFLTSLPMHIWGTGLEALRLSAVLFGLISLAGGYLLTRQLFNKNVALIALILNSAFHFHLHFSRAGFHNMEATALLVWTLALFVLAVQYRILFLYGLSGVIFGLSLQTYPSAFLMPIVVLTWIALRIFSHRSHAREVLLGFAVFGGLALITYLPQLWFFIQHPETFAARARDVWIFADSNKPHVTSVVGSTAFWPVITHQLTHALRFFIPGFDTSLQYGFKTLLFDPFTMIPALIGFSMSISRLKNSAEQLLLITILAVFLFAGALTIDPPFAPRFTPLSPLLMVFPALCLTKFCEKQSDWLTNWTLKSLLTVILCASVYWNLNYYFGRYQSTFSNQRRDYIARLVSDLGDIRSVINLFPTDEEFNYESFAFMAPGIQGVNLGAKGLSLLNDTLASVQKPTLIVAPRKLQLLELLASQIKNNRIGTSGSAPSNEFNWYVLP